MTKYTLLVEHRLTRHANAIFPLKNGQMFVLFVIGVTIGISFAVMYTQYQTIAVNRTYQLHLLPVLNDDELQHAVPLVNDTSTKHAHENDDAHANEDTTLSTKLYDEVRILCWILTTPKNHQTRAIHVKRTWGKRCNKLIFMSTKHDDSLDSIALNVSGDKPAQTWGKTKLAFQYIYQHYQNEADWFLKADDDTYVILENLRYFLYAYSTNDPIYFGYKMSRPDNLKHGYNSGGAGYVLSQNALHRFAEAMTTRSVNGNCRLNSDAGIEDIEMGKCMDALGVLSGDTRDEMNRGRFFINTPEAHLIPGQIDKSNSYWKYMWYRTNEGLHCCSDNAISFHHLRYQQMYSLDYFLYHLRPYGVVSYPQPLPKKVNFSEIAAQLDDEKPDSTSIQSN